MQQTVWEFWCRAQRSCFTIPVASAVFIAYKNIVLRVQTQELLKRNTSAEVETLAVLKQVLKLPSVSGQSSGSRVFLLEWSNCTMKSVKRHLLLKKMKDVRALYESGAKQATILITDM